jgi:hypothetical protein
MSGVDCGENQLYGVLLSLDQYDADVKQLPLLGIVLLIDKAKLGIDLFVRIAPMGVFSEVMLLDIPEKKAGKTRFGCFSRHNVSVCHQFRLPTQPPHKIPVNLPYFCPPATTDHHHDQ